MSATYRSIENSPSERFFNILERPFDGVMDQTYPVTVGTYGDWIEVDQPLSSGDIGYSMEAQNAVAQIESGVTLPDDARLFLAETVGEGADVDIANDPTFDFVRSIQVYDVRLSQDERTRPSGGTRCQRGTRIRHGTYGQNGQFDWGRGRWNELPASFTGDERMYNGCSSVNVRAVFVEWSDYEGNYGFEQVNY